MRLAPGSPPPFDVIGHLRYELGYVGALSLGWASATG
jgi:hypothetical protein